MEEESLKNFINSVIFLVKLFAGLKDKFLAQKLYDKIFLLVAGYIKLFNSKEEEGDSSHNIAAVELKNTVNSLLEFLDYLEHLKLSLSTPLLYARRNLLDFKLNLVRFHYQSIQKPKENKPVALISKNIQLRSSKESSNKNKIFNFIKRSPNSRTKEIIEEFNILSERTVKRNLKELTTEGLIRKLAKDNRVYYSAI
jgi:predicted transcriptional regulator